MRPATRAAPARCRRSSRRAPSAWEPQRLRQAQHHVHVLDRLPGRALHEIVDRGDHRESGTAHVPDGGDRSEEHTSELQSPCNLVCRLLLEKKKKKTT